MQKTISDYNLIADKFSSTRNNLTEDILNLKQYLDINSRVLDYGCGNGRVCQMFNPDNYFGVDPSEKLIKIAKEKYPIYNFFLINPLEFPKIDRFNAILCLSVIHHITNNKLQIKLLKDFYNLLDYNGKLIITTWNLADMPKSDDNIVSKPFISSTIQIDRKMYAFSQDEFENLIIDANFKILNSKISPRNKGKFSNIEIVAQK